MTRIAVVNNDTVFLEMMAEVLKEGAGKVWLDAPVETR